MSVEVSLAIIGLSAVASGADEMEVLLRVRVPEVSPDVAQGVVLATTHAANEVALGALRHLLGAVLLEV